MSKNKTFPVLVIILVLVSLPFLTACQASAPPRAMAAAPKDVASEVSVDFDFEQAAENMAFRWNAMAEAYKRNGLLNYRSNPDDVMAFRWLAMARAYEKLGMLNDRLDPGDVKAFRWLAMAREYERLGLLNHK